MATSPVISGPRTLADLINPTERQREFLEAIATHDFVLYGGEGSGGKSYILRWWLVDFLVECYQELGLQNVRVGLFCEDYPALRDRQIVKLRSELPPWLGRIHKGETWNVTLRPEYGGGEIALRNLDDPSKYVSTEFAAIAVDELTKNRLSVFNDLRWRIRWPGIRRRPFGAGANPGEPNSPGRIWVKKYWVDRNFPAEFYADEKLGRPDITKEFVLIKAKASDNPYLDPGYWQRLLSLPPDMAKRVAHGDWDSYSGQYFPFFDPKIHVIPHAEAMARIQPWWTRTLSGDWGFDHPHSFHWHAKDERNCVITHGELWDREVGETEVARRITETEAQYFKLRALKGFVFVWDAGKLSPRSSHEQPKSTGQMIEDALGPRVPRPFPADSSPGVRLIRARLMSQALGGPGDPEHKLPPQQPFWYISDACPRLIEALPTMIRDPDHSEEMLKVNWTQDAIGDDPVDSAQVGLQWMIGSAVKPDAVRLEEQFQAVRQQFVARAEALKPGEDWFAKFGGKKAEKKNRK